MNPCGWTHFGIPTGLYTSDPTQKNYPFKGKVIASNGNTVNLRNKPDKSGTILKQVKLGEIVTVTGKKWMVLCYLWRFERIYDDGIHSRNLNKIIKLLKKIILITILIQIRF